MRTSDSAKNRFRNEEAGSNEIAQRGVDRIRSAALAVGFRSGAGKS
jgi:hypothetical protein